MRTTGGKGESASFLLGGRVGLILHLGRENVGPPVNFGRFRGPNGPAGGAFAPVEGREIAAAVAGGAAAADWRLWCWTHWLQPAVSPTRKGGESASSARPGKGGKCQFSPTGKGGKVPSLALAEISRRWRLRGGAGWRQRSFAFLRPIRPPKLEAPRQYQDQRGLF